MITNEHIAYISKDLQYRGIVEDHVQHEMLDHLCELVEANMRKGQRFMATMMNILLTRLFRRIGGIFS